MRSSPGYARVKAELVRWAMAWPALVVIPGRRDRARIPSRQQLLAGGARAGNFYQPTVITPVSQAALCTEDHSDRYVSIVR